MRLDDALKGSEGPPSTLWDLVDHLPRESALYRAANPDWMWTPEMQLQATYVDEMRFWRYQYQQSRRETMKHGLRPPDPIPRPGVTPPEDQNVYGRGSAMPMEDMAEWLGGGFANLN